MNTVTKVLESPSFDLNAYKKDINRIFEKYNNDGFIKLPFRIQVFSDYVKNI